MDRLVLTQPVRVTGQSFFGRRASVLLEPINEPGWFWQVKNQKMLIVPELFQRRFRTTMLHRSGEKLATLWTPEHLMALRFSGLDSVCVISEGPLPYDGSAAIFWNEVKPFTEKSGTLTLCTPCQSITKFARRNIDFYPAPPGSNVLHLTVNINYSHPQLGACSMKFTFPNDFEKVVSAKAQGWPAWWRYPAGLAHLFGWPHFSNVVWPQEYQGDADALTKFATHRALDFLGDMAVGIPPGAMIIGEAYSHRAGHSQDIEFLRTMYKLNEWHMRPPS